MSETKSEKETKSKQTKSEDNNMDKSASRSHAKEEIASFYNVKCDDQSSQRSHRSQKSQKNSEIKETKEAKVETQAACDKPTENQCEIKLEDVSPVLKSEESEILLNKMSNESKCILYIIFLLPFFYLTIIIMMVTANIYFQFSSRLLPTTDFDESLIVMKRITENAKLNPILKISFVNPQESCPNGWEPNPVTIKTFAGIESGCFCMTKGEGAARPSSFCESAVFGCSEVLEIPEKPMTIFNKKEMCIKRASSFHIRGREESCENGFKKCGDHYCLPSKEICPIQELRVSNKFMKSLYKDPEILKLGDTEILVKRLAANNHPLVKFDATNTAMGYRPCLNPKFAPVPQVSLNFPLNKIPQEGCGKYGEYPSAHDTKIEENMRAFYAENNFERHLTGIPHYYDSYLKPRENLKIFGINRINLNLEKNSCRNITQSQVHDLEHVPQSVDVFRHFSAICCVLGLIFSAVAFILALVVALLTRVKRSSYKNYFSVVYILTLIVCFFVLTPGIYYLVLRNNNYAEVHKYFDDFLNNQCLLDEDSGVKIAALNISKYFEDRFLIFGKFLILVLSWSIAFLCIFIGCVIHGFYNKKYVFVRPF